MDEFDRVCRSEEPDSHDFELRISGEWVDVTPAAFLPYAPAWTAWLEHAVGCLLCTRATVKFIKGLDVYEVELCNVGAPLGMAATRAISEQKEFAALN